MVGVELLEALLDLADLVDMVGAKRRVGAWQSWCTAESVRVEMLRSAVNG